MTALTWWLAVLPVLLGADFCVWRMLRAPWYPEMHPVSVPLVAASVPDFTFDHTGLV